MEREDGNPSVVSRIISFFSGMGKKRKTRGRTAASRSHFRTLSMMTLPPIDISAYGDPDTILYTFKVWDHRTEGRIHINKRDLELYQADPEGSEGKTQGGRHAGGRGLRPLCRPGYCAPGWKIRGGLPRGDLVAVAATDKNGDASFLVNTEKPGSYVKETAPSIPRMGIRGRRASMMAAPSPPPPEGFGRLPTRTMGR